MWQVHKEYNIISNDFVDIVFLTCMFLYFCKECLIHVVILLISVVFQS